VLALDLYTGADCPRLVMARLEPAHPSKKKRFIQADGLPVKPGNDGRTGQY